MANTLQAKKRVRQNETRHVRNASLRTKFRTFVKKVLYAINDGDKNAAQEAYKKAVPVIDSMVNKGIIHENKAARHKSRLNTHIKKMPA